MGEDSPKPASTPTGAVFLSYASQDAEAARRICEALQAAGIEVWFDQSELRGGDAWDQKIRKQIKTCALFIPVISHATHDRREGYFRLEWKLAVDRSHLMDAELAFLLPVVIDDTCDDDERVPDRFREVQWTRLLGGQASPAFVERVRRLLSPEAQSTSEPAVHAVSDPAPGRKPRRAPWPVAILVLVAVGVGYLALDRFVLSKRLAPAPVAQTAARGKAAINPPLHSIAVLPFVDLSEKHDQEYFADGMAEQVIDLLSKVSDLRVTARTSSFYFKGKAASVRDIARELSVAHLLEGSVRKSGDRIRVTTQLVRADNGYHIWSETYDRDLKDVFKVQDDIANKVVQGLQISLLGGRLTRSLGGTENLEAYQWYLRGLDATRKNSRTSIAIAEDCFNHAIKLDPQFGLPWGELARDFILLADNGTITPKAGYEHARSLAERALQLSPDLAQGHAVLAYVHRTYDWDWAGAETEANRALQLDPTEPSALMEAAMIANTLGHWGEALRQQRLGLIRDPLFPLLIWWLGETEYAAGQFADSEATFRKLLTLSPDFAWTRLYLAKTLLAEDKPEEAVAVLLEESDEQNRLMGFSMALSAAHRDAEADEARKTLIAKFADSDAYWVAMAYARRGESDSALGWLDRAYKQRDPSLPEILGEHMFDKIALDLRYKAFLRKMNLPG